MIDEALAVLRSLSFAQPQVLWFLALLPVLVPLLVWARLRRTRVSLRAGVLLVRIAVIGLLLGALAAPTLRPTGHARAMVFAVDVSDSVAADQQAFANAWIDQAVAQLPPGSHWNRVEFGERPQMIASGADQHPGGSSTDLAAALKLAGSLLPSDPSTSPEIVLFTDGWPTSGPSPTEDLPPGIAVSHVALPASSSTQKLVTVIHEFDAPPTARSGDRIDLSLDLQSSAPVDAQLRVWLDSTTVADEPVHLEPGDTRLTFQQRLGAAGFSAARAELQVGSQISRMSSTIVVKPAGQVLVLEDDPNQADALVSLLNADGLQVDRRPSSSLPPSASSLSQYDGAVLVNTPATSLSLDQQRTLVSFVQDLGRGLMVVGGSRSFGPGGYEGTVLDDLLPVSAVPPIEPQQGSLALILVIDRSGSMDVLSGGTPATGAASKLAMAREAAIQAAGLLQPQDTLGVITFDTSFQWVVSPTRLQGPDDVARAQSQISTIRPGGGTTILPALVAAYEAEMQIDAPLKHIVLLTDGESNDRGYEDLIAKMQAAQITLSTLAIGSDADTRLLSNLAHLGGGRYYFTERSSQIPRIASKETTILTRNAVVEGRVAAVVADPSPILRSVQGDLPPLSGYVATTRKDRAVTALETERGHPLLAHWQYGLGRVVAWTSEAQQGWGADWSTWPDAARFWSQAVRWSLPAPVRSDFQPSIQLGTDGRQLTLSVQALLDDGRFADLQDTRATVLAPDGSAREVSLPQTAPGTYELTTRVNTPGNYRVLFRQGTREEVAAFSVPDAIELHSAGANFELLDNLARASGGRELFDTQTAVQPASGAGPAFDLWPWLVLAALVLFPLDVLLRRRV
jgi:Mg-chelatase subunit ChlD